MSTKIKNIPKNLLPDKASIERFESKKQYVKRRLKEIGLSWYQLKNLESRHLPKILHKNEKIEAVVAGNSEMGHIMMVATDRRLIIIDSKPLFSNDEDIGYNHVAGVSLRRVGLNSDIILHTRVGNFGVVTSGHESAKHFKDFIDKKCIELNKG